MKWKQFFTPVQSMTAPEAQEYLNARLPDSVTILDVRQPGEYATGHIPGALLIPLPQLKDRMDEVDPTKPVVAYCAVGGRSRVAAQILTGADYQEVYNLSGGFKAWQDHRAVGPEDSGLELFDGLERIEAVLIVSYALEQGLREFYLDMREQVDSEPARALFTKLADIEVHHQDAIFGQYNRLTGEKTDRREFEERIVVSAVEGGLSTEQFLELYDADLDSTDDIIGLAMTIEAQALDMYSRAARNAADAQSRTALVRIAREEQIHLKLLGELLDHR